MQPMRHFGLTVITVTRGTGISAPVESVSVAEETEVVGHHALRNAGSRIRGGNETNDLITFHPVPGSVRVISFEEARRAALSTREEVRAVGSGERVYEIEPVGHDGTTQSVG